MKYNIWGSTVPELYSAFDALKDKMRGPTDTENRPLRRSTKPQEKKNILIIDDDEVSFRLTAGLLSKLGYDADVSDHEGTGTEKLVTEGFSLLILDWVLWDKTGAGVLNTMQEIMIPPKQPIPLIICSGHPKEQMKIPELKYFELIDIWEKPAKLKIMEATLEKVKDRLPRRVPIAN